MFLGYIVLQVFCGYNLWYLLFAMTNFLYYYYYYHHFFIWRNSPWWDRASSFTRFLDQTQRRTTFGRTALDE